jgi:hypothetical protein
VAQSPILKHFPLASENFRFPDQWQKHALDPYRSGQRKYPRRLR